MIQWMEVLNPGDLPGAIITEADRMMDKVYGNRVHQNPGTHLDGEALRMMASGKTIIAL
jgi:hypothetical protein